MSSEVWSRIDNSFFQLCNEILTVFIAVTFPQDSSTTVGTRNTCSFTVVNYLIGALNDNHIRMAVML